MNVNVAYRIIIEVFQKPRPYKVLYFKIRN